jgi:hypothetical protein
MLMKFSGETWIPVQHEDSREYLPVYDEEGSIWTYRGLYGAYYKTIYDITHHTEALTAGCVFGFYGGYNLIWSSQSERPENPTKGTYYLDEDENVTYRAKFEKNEDGEMVFQEWEEISQTPTFIREHELPAIMPMRYGIYPTGYYEIADLKAEYGSLPTMWNRYPGETYTQNVKFDEDGMHITAGGNEMYIDEDEIIALYNTNVIFQITKDLTTFAKVKTNQLDIEPFSHRVQNINGNDYYLFY